MWAPRSRLSSNISLQPSHTHGYANILLCVLLIPRGVVFEDWGTDKGVWDTGVRVGLPPANWEAMRDCNCCRVSVKWPVAVGSVIKGAVVGVAGRDSGWTDDCCDTGDVIGMGVVLG